MSGKSVISLDKSPFAKVKPVGIENVKVAGLLGMKMKINRQCSIPSLYKSFLDHGTINNFLIRAGEMKGEIDRRCATDSDLYKWMEAVSFDLQNSYSEENDKLLDWLISKLEKAMEPSGYLNTFWTENYEPERFKQLEGSHELYCGGHMLQAAIAHFRATGKNNFMKLALKWADYICSQFGPGKIEKNDGHPEIEMALIELYRTTGLVKYLRLAEFFLNMPNHRFDKRTFLAINEIASHAVCMMYLCCGASDYYIETGKKEYLDNLIVLWNDLCMKRIYITGGIGCSHHNEGFGFPYELPNLYAYSESCAGIALMMWNHRMFCVEPDAKYIDLIETILYNNFLASVSLDGTKYFYRNPLASKRNNERVEWYNCTCCPPNIERMMSSLPGYFYCTDDDSVYVNLYGSSTAKIQLQGHDISLIQETDYPWNGKIRINVKTKKPFKFNLYLRIPAWCNKAGVLLNDKKFKAKQGKYLKISRIWSDEEILLDFQMNPELIITHPEVWENRNAACIKRGPIVFCLESDDNPVINLFTSRISDKRLKYKFEHDFLGGVGSISGNIMYYTREKLPLYDSRKKYPKIPFKFKKFKAIPYHAWGNRSKSEMNLWLPIKG